MKNKKKIFLIISSVIFILYLLIVSNYGKKEIKQEEQRYDSLSIYNEVKSYQKYRRMGFEITFENKSKLLFFPILEQHDLFKENISIGDTIFKSSHSDTLILKNEDGSIINFKYWRRSK
jgi:hypothetical protein